MAGRGATTMNRTTWSALTAWVQVGRRSHGRSCSRTGVSSHERSPADQEATLLVGVLSKMHSGEARM